MAGYVITHNVVESAMVGTSIKMPSKAGSSVMAISTMGHTWFKFLHGYMVLSDLFLVLFHLRRVVSDMLHNLVMSQHLLAVFAYRRLVHLAAIRPTVLSAVVHRLPEVFFVVMLSAVPMVTYTKSQHAQR